MPPPLGVASSLFLYSLIPSVPFVGYSIAVPTILSLWPAPDGCSPNILIYLLSSYVLAYLFLLFSFSISLFPLPGFSCFHRLDVKLVSLSSLSVLHLLSLAHAVVFLLLPAYAPDMLAFLAAAVDSSYMPNPLPSACTSVPTFYASLAGVGVQCFFLLWLLCTVVVAAGKNQCWSGWAAEELREIEEAKVRHAQWRAEREEERRKLIDGDWYKPADAVTQLPSVRQPEVQADKAPTMAALPPQRLSASSKRREKEEEKEEEDEDEILRYTRKMAAVRRKEREKKEEKEQSDDVEEETEDDEGDESFSSSSSSSSSSSASASPSASSRSSLASSETEASESEEDGSDSRDDEAGKGDEEAQDKSETKEEEAASEQDEADEQRAEEAGGKEDENDKREQDGNAYGDQYGALAVHAHASRSAAAPTLPPKSTARSSAAPLPLPATQQQPMAVEEPPTVQSFATQTTPRRLSHPMSRTTAVRQVADMGFGATVPLAKALPILPAAATSTVAHAQHVNELPPLPPMPAFAATAPITIPASSFLPSPTLAPPSLYPPPSATFSSHSPPLPIVAVPLRRPRLTPLLLHPPLRVAPSTFGRTTSSASPPLPISPIPLSPKAFIAASSPCPLLSPLPVASPPPLVLSGHIVNQAPVPSVSVPIVVPSPLAVIDGSAAVSHSLPHSLPLSALLTPPLPISSERAPPHRQPVVPAHSQQEQQLVAELQAVQQHRQQQQPSEPSQQTEARQHQPDIVPAQSEHSRADEPQLQHHQQQQQSHQQRLSDTGQFVVETIPDAHTHTPAEHEPIVHASVDGPAEVAAEEVSFSDDEEGSDDAQHAGGRVQQTLQQGAAVVEQSVVLEEEVEEEVF